MLIKEVDFKNINQFKETNVIPVFMQYGNECYEISTNLKQVENSWAILQKVFYYKFYLDNKEYLHSLFDTRLFKNSKSDGVFVFSCSDKTFHNEVSNGKTTATKFGDAAFVVNRRKKYENLIILKKVVLESALKDFRLFVTTAEEIIDDEFKKEFAMVKKQFTRKRKNPYRIKKGNLVVGHINGLILTDEEKLIKYVRDEFKKKNLLGDIIINEKQEEILKSYMKIQLERFNRNPSSFKPDYNRVFALALVRYAMKNYNTRGTADFWPYFKDDYGLTISGNNQKYIHNIFENVIKQNDMIYAENLNQKIDNITMHAFVADNSADQLFNYLFDFWRLDLGRNSDNLNNQDKNESSFETLIEAMKNSSQLQNVTSHTSLLLNFPKIVPVFKNRIKRIIRLMNEAFWDDISINETGNRINHLLNLWIEKPGKAFQKEKRLVAKHNLRDKGEILFHSPVFSVDYDKEKLYVVLPNQRLLNGTEEDDPMWIIKCSNDEFETLNIPTASNYKRDSIGYYVEKMTVEIPLHLMLSSFEISLILGENEVKRYKIQESKIRFFDGKGRFIDHKNIIIPEGNITSYSDSVLYPNVLGENLEIMKSDGLIMKNFNLTLGEVVTLEDNSGLQVGQKLTEGLNSSYPVNGVALDSNNAKYKIYSELPKLLFRAKAEELNGISLVVNGKQNKVIEHNISEFKIANDLKTLGYLIDLNDYIKNEGVYSVALSFPRMHKQIDVGSFAFIKNFNFKFINAPYIFTDYGKISFSRNVKIDKKTRDADGVWTQDVNGDTFSFNFGDRNENSENFCNLVEDNELVLKCNVAGVMYPVKFEIPALYWKFSTNDEWNTRQPAKMALKNLKNKKLYINGPFNFAKSVITTTDDVDIAEEESEIKMTQGKAKSFDIGKAYYWFKNDHSEIYRKLYISLDERKINLFDVICKSNLQNVSLYGDFENNILEGVLDIEGDEEYTVSIYHNGKTICEDEQVTNKRFKIETELETGDYEVYVYEILEDDDSDGFDVGNESILINKNGQAIVKKLINLEDLESQKITLLGYQDLKEKFIPQNFSREYCLTRLRRTNYSNILEADPDSEMNAIWNENTRYDKEALKEYIMYEGKLEVYRFDGLLQFLTNVLIIFTDKMKQESIIVSEKDESGYESLIIDRDKKRIVTNNQSSKMDKYGKSKCSLFFDDEYFYKIEIEEV